MAKHPKDIPRKNKEGVSQHTTHQENWKLVWEMNQATEDLSFQQSPEIKSFKEMYRDQFGEFVCGYWLLNKFSLSVPQEIYGDQTTKNNNKFYWKLENN